MSSLEPIIDWLITPGNFDLRNNWFGDKECEEYKALIKVLKSLKKLNS